MFTRRGRQKGSVSTPHRAVLIPETDGYGICGLRLITTCIVFQTVAKTSGTQPRMMPSRRTLALRLGPGPGARPPASCFPVSAVALFCDIVFHKRTIGRFRRLSGLTRLSLTKKTRRSNIPGT